MYDRLDVLYVEISIYPCDVMTMCVPAPHNCVPHIRSIDRGGLWVQISSNTSFLEVTATLLCMLVGTVG